MNTFKYMAAMALGVMLVWMAGCSSDISSGVNPPDGDLEQADQAELSDQDTQKAEPESDSDLAETESEAPLDGDKDASEVPEALSEADSADSDAVSEVVDGDSEFPAEQESVEAETEGEVVPACQPSDSIFGKFQVLAEPRFSATAYHYDGHLDDSCQVDGFLIAGAQGMDVTLRLATTPGAESLSGRLSVLDIGAYSGHRTGETYYDQHLSSTGELAYSFTLPYTGEYVVAVSSTDYATRGAYSLDATCTAHCDDKLFTRHPIVLMHGMAGFDKALGLLEYFNGVPDDLTDKGYVVYATQAAMFNDSNARAAEIESQLMDILATTGARKLNLIGHSQGGLDARHFISGLGHGDVVASLTMVATPNRGTIVGDIVQGKLPGWSQDVIYAIVDFFANLLEANENDTREALKQVSVDYVQNTFNPTHPDDPRVQYYSHAGITCNLLDFDCRNAHSDERVLTAMAPTYTIIHDAGSDTDIGCGTNDGMVPLNSAQWGTFLGTVDADHADEIGQLKTGDFDHIGFYRNIAAYLVGENF